MNRIKKKFDELSSEGKKALIPYITPEFPFKGITVPLLQELARSGVDLIEVGIPYSDPLADGPTIQHSSEIALQHGVNLPTIFSAVREFRKRSEIPILLMGYINPIFRFGTKKFLEECRNAGVDGVIIPDFPIEEASSLKKESERFGVSNVFLIAPTSPDERIKRIDEFSTDFSYCVSVTGVTGARTRIGTNGSLDHFLERVKQNVKKKFVVGFGISNADQVRRIWRYADGAVVGSALIEVLRGTSTRRDAVLKAGEFLRSLR